MVLFECERVKNGEPQVQLPLAKQLNDIGMPLREEATNELFWVSLVTENR
jgi:hypothetical protein